MYNKRKKVSSVNIYHWVPPILISWSKIGKRGKSGYFLHSGSHFYIFLHWKFWTYSCHHIEMLSQFLSKDEQNPWFCSKFHFDPEDFIFRSAIHPKLALGFDFNYIRSYFFINMPCKFNLEFKRVACVHVCTLVVSKKYGG